MGLLDDLRKDYQELTTTIRVLERYAKAGRRSGRRALANVETAMALAAGNGQGPPGRASAMDLVLELLTRARGPMQPAEVRAAIAPSLRHFKNPGQSVYTALYQLRIAKKIRKTKRGWIAR